MVIRPGRAPIRSSGGAYRAAIAFLRSLGTSAHVWLPGASGVSVASLPSNNYLLSDFATYSGADDVVGGVKDGMNPSGGISLTQATTANKPILRRGMYNHLTWNNQLNHSPWAFEAASAPTPTFVREDSTNTYHRATDIGNPSPVAGQPYTYCVDASYAGRYLVINTVNTLGARAIFDLQAGTVNQLIGTASIAALGGGVYRCCTSGIAVAVGARYVGISATNADTSYQGDGVSGVNIFGAGMFQGIYTAAQILAEGGIPTTTATAASNPSAGKYWWSFNGSNNSLLSGNLGITNACTIVIAGRVDSFPANTVLIGEDANGVQISIASNGEISFTKKAVVILVTSPAAAIVAGVPFVIAARLSSGTAVIRKNGVQIATAATAQVFAATTGARIGSAFDTTLPTNGALGWVVPLPTALSDADCLTVERLVGSQFPGMAVF